MPDYTNDFNLDPQHAWLNTASEGPIPKVAAEALQEAVGWKSSPERLTIPKFQQVPLALKQSLATLINVSEADIILGNSATYGLHLLANGLPLNAGDEIIVMQNDFPTDILPWLHLAKKGIHVHQIKGKGPVMTANDIQASLTAHTKIVCLPHVHSFSGHALDIKGIGDMCRRQKVIFIVNMSQSIGSFPVDVGELPVDAVVCAGYKWLLGPYGTGFCWMTKDLREALDYPQAYWIALMNEQSLATEGELFLPPNYLARHYDVFGTANFFNFVPWRASIEYLIKTGMDQVASHNRNLMDIFLDRLDSKKYVLTSPTKPVHTNIAVVSHVDASRNAAIFEHLKSKGVHGALWKNKIRVSPHIFNTSKEIERALEGLNNV